MTNESKSREEQIVDMARHIRAGDLARACRTIDISDFSLSQANEIGSHRLATAVYLHDMGYRLEQPDDVTIVVKDGRVDGVYSTNTDIAVHVIDLDIRDPEELEQLHEDLEHIAETQTSIW